MITSHFVSVRYLLHYVTNNDDYTANQKIIYEAAVGTGSGIVIFVFSEVYNIVCGKVAAWENHMYESDKENSYLVKTFIFNFFVSYLLLFYYAFADPDILNGDVSKKFSTLGTNFISMILMKSFASMGKLHILPFVLFFLKNRKLKKQWPVYRKSIKTQFVS